MRLKQFREKLNENKSLQRKILKDLEDAEENYDLANIDHVVKAMKRDRNLSKIAYLAVELQKAAKKYEKTDRNRDYEDMLDAYDKLRANIYD